MILASISNNAVSLHDSFLAAREAEEESIRNSVIVEEVCDFGTILENTELYRKASVRQVLRYQTRKSEIATNSAASSRSVAGKPVEQPVPFHSGLTAIPSNSPSRLEGPKSPSFGDGGPKPETILGLGALDRKSTLAPVQRADHITNPPCLKQIQARNIVKLLKAVKMSAVARLSPEPVKNQQSPESLTTRLCRMIL